MKYIIQILLRLDLFMQARQKSCAKGKRERKKKMKQHYLHIRCISDDKERK